MRIFRHGWRASWIGRFLNIHGLTAHAMETCWCIGTKRQMANPPHFYTKSQALADMEAFYRYASAISETGEHDRPGDTRPDQGHQGSGQGNDGS